jgi:hypothetical protein
MENKKKLPVRFFLLHMVSEASLNSQKDNSSPDQEKDSFRIQGVKKHRILDPGSGSATPEQSNNREQNTQSETGVEFTFL